MVKCSFHGCDIGICGCKSSQDSGLKEAASDDVKAVGQLPPRLHAAVIKTSRALAQGFQVERVFGELEAAIKEYLSSHVTKSADATGVSSETDQERLVEEIARLERFKAYVHKRLDDAGVPIDPDSPHKAEGCRIGGRLDWLIAERVSPSASVEHVEQEEEKQALLVKAWHAIRPLSDNFGHWLAGMSEGDKAKPCTFSPPTWSDAENADYVYRQLGRAIGACKHDKELHLCSYCASSVPKGTENQPTPQVSPNPVPSPSSIVEQEKKNLLGEKET